MLAHIRTIVLIAGMLGMSACAASAPAAPPPRQIVSTTSFGMCAGYCRTRLELVPGRAILVRESNEAGRGAPALPRQQFETELSAGEWDIIARLAAATNLSNLPDVIGCPDCADGGAETLAIGGGRTIAFDFGATVEPAQPLLDRVRAIRERMTPIQ